MAADKGESFVNDEFIHELDDRSFNWNLKKC